MVWIVVIIFLAVLVLGPQLWVKQVMSRHSDERSDFPGTGGELAEHLLNEFGVDNVGVETTDRGDHYDPDDRMVRLTAGNFEGKSLTAVAVAAHEVGHALQHRDGLNGRKDAGLRLRQRMVGLAQVSDKIASVFFLVAPVLGILARTPTAFFGMVAFGVALLAVRIAVHLVTLPVEFDASFRKALPILKEGGYLHDDDLLPVRKVLKAAALTYVAAAAMSLIDLARWIRILR